MNNKLFVFLGLILVLLGCKGEEETKLVSKTFTEEFLRECKKTQCPEITVAYTFLEGEGLVAEKINATIKDFIIQSLHIGDPDQKSTAETIEEASSQFIKTYWMHTAEFPEMKTEYFADISVTDLYSSPSLLSLEMRNYLFTGGAHGYGMVYFTNFDPKTGEEMTLESIFNDFNAFTEFVENKFREKFEIADSESINSTGFWFEDDSFYLPETLGFTDSEVIIQYNQYDIASYADGPIVLEIPLDEVAPYLKLNLE